MTANDDFQGLVGKLMGALLSNKEQDITLNLEKVQLKLPIFEQPVELSGKLTISLSSKKKK